MARHQSSRPPARDRILAAASRLFYQEGVQNVGIDRIIAESGVAKMSLYNHFKSKDALIAAWLQQRDKEWNLWFQSRIEALSTGIDFNTDQKGECCVAQQQLLMIFDVLHEWFNQPNFRGCAFINSTVELADLCHPGSQVAIAHQKTILDYVHNLTTMAGLSNPDILTQQLMILIEGSIMVAMMQQHPKAAMHAKQAASVLINDMLLV